MGLTAKELEQLILVLLTQHGIEAETFDDAYPECAADHECGLVVQGNLAVNIRRDDELSISDDSES